MAARDTASLLAGLLVLLHTWGAWAVVDVTMEEKVEVFLGETAQITCKYTSDDGIGGTIIEWFYVSGLGKRQQIWYHDSMVTTVSKNTPYTNRMSVNVTHGEVVLTIRQVQVKDDVEFICSVKPVTDQKDGSADGGTKLRVFAKPGLPTIEGVQTVIPVNKDKPSKIGTCEVRNGYPKPNITWYKNKVPLRTTPNVVDVKSFPTTESSGLFSVKSELSLTVEPEDKDASFYCEVTYFVPGATRMTETSTINIAVLKPSTFATIWIESPKGKIKEGDTVELHCKGDGNSASSITIKHTNHEQSWENSLVVLKNVTRLNSGEYECKLMDMESLEEFSGNTTVFVHYLDPAAIKPSETIVVDSGKEVKVTCNALSSLSTETIWFKNERKISKDHTLILTNATFDAAGTYVCVVSVPEIDGMETRSSLRVHVRGPPEIIDKPLDDIKTSEKTVELSCHVRGYPTPSITWTNSEGKVIKAASETETEDGAQSVVSVPVASEFSVFCNASNQFGADMATFNIKIRSNGVVIAVIIICILLLAILGSVLYFLYKKGKICNRSEKQDITREKSSKDNIVVEMKSDNTEEAILLGVNGEKQRGDQ